MSNVRRAHELQVVHTMALDGFEADEVARLAACVERGASHPLASAVVGLAASRNLPLTATVSDSREVAGRVRNRCRYAGVQGHYLRVGSAHAQNVRKNMARS